MSCNYTKARESSVRGNDFYISATLAYLKQTTPSKVWESFDFTACDSYTARAYMPGIGKEDNIATLVGLKDGTIDTLVLDVDGSAIHSLVVVEITGVLDGRNFRSAVRGFIDIVEYDDQAKVVFTPWQGHQESNLVMTLQFLPTAAVVGKNAYEIWKEEPGNEDKTLDDFIYFLGHGESAYEIAVRYGYTGTEAEYNALYFNAVDAANGAAQSANGAAESANTAAGAANDAAALVGNRLDTIDDQMAHLCYHDVAGEEVPDVDFDPETDTVHVTAQTLSDQQKQQARTNIGAAGVNDIVGIPIVNHGTSDKGTSSTSYSIAPNTLHVWGEVDALYLSLTTGEVGYVQEYMIQFESGATATTLDLPSSIQWINNVTPSDVQANYLYQISILNGVGVIGGVDLSSSSS